MDKDGKRTTIDEATMSRGKVLQPLKTVDKRTPRKERAKKECRMRNKRWMKFLAPDPPDLSP